MQREALVRQLRGAHVAAITPMTGDGDVDHAGLAKNLEWMHGTGLQGYLLLGSTGEQVHLTEFERALVLEIGRRHIPTDRVLIAGTGLMGTRATIEETRRAAEAGADVALVVTPSYYQKAMTAPTLTDHYRTVAEASPIPVMLYSVPGITRVTMPPAVVEALASHPNVVGMKNSGSDPQVALAYREAARGEEFLILSGSALASPGLLLLGAIEGVILGVANILPEASAALVEAARSGDLGTVREQGDLLRRGSEWVGRYGIAGWKAGVEARGYHGGPARSPLRNLSAEEARDVARAVEALLEESGRGQSVPA